MLPHFPFQAHEHESERKKWPIPASSQLRSPKIKKPAPRIAERAFVSVERRLIRRILRVELRQRASVIGRCKDIEQPLAVETAVINVIQAKRFDSRSDGLIIRIHLIVDGFIEAFLHVSVRWLGDDEFFTDRQNGCARIVQARREKRVL